ncbi:hypothetical protein LEN26_016196 [Aphanomyces euteiches]|nr:hypothetical protein LEN26_016196 [Aphanomyces euteiches]KAH9181181.1 hypothetical protein AeNC1_016840 [Aphanomyces euteiches]
MSKPRAIARTSQVRNTASCPDLRGVDVRRPKQLEHWFDESFPNVHPSARGRFFQLDDPQAILYATMGLRLISQRSGSVAAFGSELNAMSGVDATTRSIVMDFLSNAFRQ